MYETIYIQIFQEVVHAWNMYIIKSQKPCLMSLGFLVTLTFSRLATRYEFFRVTVVRALGSMTCSIKNPNNVPWIALICSYRRTFCFLHSIFNSNERKSMNMYMIIYIKTMIINKLCTFFMYFEDLFTCFYWVLHEEVANVVPT